MRRMLIALPLLVAGCATGPSLDQRLAPFIGRSEGDLVSALGVPSRTYVTEGRKFLQYDQRWTQVVPGGFYNYGPYWRSAPLWAPPVYVLRACDITFTLREGRVEGFTWRGDGCR
ncbi:MAG: hypothetical protein IRY87_10450 [Acetobacteraceae bacterium]|nr:hypothetical protein [Acetobacteraceae bacterium]